MCSLGGDTSSLVDIFLQKCAIRLKVAQAICARQTCFCYGPPRPPRAGDQAGKAPLDVMTPG